MLQTFVHLDANLCQLSFDTFFYVFDSSVVLTLKAGKYGQHR